MRIAAIIVAAGEGRRAGGGLPKQFRALGDRTLLGHAVQGFLSHAGISDVIVVAPKAGTDVARSALGALSDDVKCVPGGATRQQSVRAGLEALLAAPPDLVLIHDAARPLVSRDQIDRVIAASGPSHGAAPGIALTDAVWGCEGDRITATPPRDGLVRAQTPQAFPFAALLAAHRVMPDGAADDVAVALAAGLDVRWIEGEEGNLKITRPEDFARASALMAPMKDIRTGNGYDVHAFTDGDHVILCGVRLPHTLGLLGHSDADVAMHAVTDAIYGALAAGDIGRWFPPSDPQWKGAASEIFLAHAAALASQARYRIAALDCTIICEAPKIAPHAADMAANLARITGAEPSRISVKATTSEGLGFTGRREGIAAIATATLIA